MKIKKMVGAFALTAALAMGSVPAFAGSVDTAAGDATFSENGSTDIKAKVENVNNQVRATVPLQVTVVFGSKDGSDILGPSSTAYKITNVGTDPIKLMNAELQDVNSTFATTKMCSFGTNKFKTWDGENGEWGNTPATGQNIMFTFEAGPVKTFLTSDHKAGDAVAQTKDTRYVDGGTAWPTGGIQIAKDGDLPINLGGVAYFNTALASGDLTDTLCKIKYTIAAA